MDNTLTQNERAYLSTIRDEVQRQDLETHILTLRREFQEVLSTDAGRHVIWSIIEGSNAFANTFSANSYTYFNEGKRAVGLKIIEQIMSACPEKWIKMQEDYLNTNSFNLNK